MTNSTINRPEETEYLPYYSRYISLVPEGDILAVLDKQADETVALLRSIPEAQGGFRYAPDKWTIKELVGHVIDGERIFAYRALRFARNDETPLPGYEQDDYIRNASFDDYPLSELAAEFEHVRRATLFLFKHMNGESWTRRGLANDAEVSVRALAYIIAGHELHHREILRDRYLSAIEGI
ncbi:MAG: DinB family protein [Pyrinomonadaceae bacterium]